MADGTSPETHLGRAWGIAKLCFGFGCVELAITCRTQETGHQISMPNGVQGGEKGSMASVVVIPENYEELSKARGQPIIPICISAVDQLGRLIAPDWFRRGVAPIRTELVEMAHYQLGDPWCASELAETTVHRLWARHGSNVGRFPARRVLKKAMWISEELKYGDWHKMRFHNLYLALDALDLKIRDAMLPDPSKYAELFEQQIMLDSVEEQLELEGRTQIRTMFQLMRRGYSWREIAERVGAGTGEIAKRRFYRWLRKSPPA
jgi:hypothetical protein